jgi:tRNA (guanine37-N1)-methyltransferase
MRIDIMTLFPDCVESVLHSSILGRAIKRNAIEINAVQIRDYTNNKQMQVDDYPYGGGRGCIMMAQPLKSCLDAIIQKSGDCSRRVIYLSPQGQRFTQETAKRYVHDYEQLILVCGHYEGIDERFIEECVDEELSIGDFVLTGGEIAAMAVADAVCRLVPGVLSDEECFTEESHWNGLLEYPQYTRPEVWENRAVPEVLLNGDHALVDSWRREQSLRRTLLKRPDMFFKFTPADDYDRKMIDRILKNRGMPGENSLELHVATDDKEILRAAVELNIDENADFLNVFNKQGRGLWYLFVCPLGDVGIAAVNDFIPNVENELTDGHWKLNGLARFVEYFYISKKFRTTGFPDRAMELLSKKAREDNRKVLRTRIYRKQKNVRRFLERQNFKYRGNLLSENGKERYMAFEKDVG